MAKIIMKLFTHWGLSTADQLELLGLSPKSRGLLARYAKGEALPEGRDSLDRVGYLLAIHKSLRLLYPYNPEIRYSWVNRRNTAFNNLTPLAVMKEQGIIGLARVARYLDYYRGL
nr:MbcA/ParS/Xre antitoxin family protein [Geobacter hydrogenophilus]